MEEALIEETLNFIWKTVTFLASVGFLGYLVKISMPGVSEKISVDQRYLRLDLKNLKAILYIIANPDIQYRSYCIKWDKEKKSLYPDGLRAEEKIEKALNDFYKEQSWIQKLIIKIKL